VIYGVLVTLKGLTMTATVLRFARSKAHRAGAIYADAMEVARVLAPDEPVFCFSAERLISQAKTFIDGFPGVVSFAVKSNSSEQVIRKLYAAGIRVWDVASVQEMDLVAAAAPGATFHYHNPVKSIAEIRDAYRRYGCRRFAVDCIEELHKIHAVADSPGDNTEIAVRFVLPREAASSAHDFCSKFGADEDAATELLRQARSLGFKSVLTFHPGSQCTDPRAYDRHIRAAGRIAAAAEVTLTTLNVGGGFPARYVRSGSQGLPQYFEVIKSAFGDVFGLGSGPKLECEPGRGLAAACMSVLAKVKLVRNDKDEIFLNDGIYGALMEVAQAPELEPPHRVIRDGAVLGDASRMVSVYGPTCDPLDKLPMQIAVPADIRDGDYIEFGTLGAYGSATMTRFNGYGGHKTVRVVKVLEA
jgi:ornithine decarboxylase